MKTFNSKVFTVSKDINTLFGLVASPSNLQPLLEKLGDKFSADKVKVTENAIQTELPGLGAVSFVKEAEDAPNQVKYAAQGTPVPLTLVVNLAEQGEGKTDVQLSLDVEVPAFMGGMVGNTIKPMLDKVTDALAGLQL